MTQEEFQAAAQLILGCEFLLRPVCFLALWKGFCRPDRDRRDLLAAGLFFLIHAVWWFTEAAPPLRLLFAVTVFLYCHIRYGRYYERAVFLMLLHQHIWAFGVLVSICVQECLDSRLAARVADPEYFYPGIESVVYAAFVRNRIISGVILALLLLFLTVLIIKAVKHPFEPGWYDTIFLSIFSVVGYLFIKMTIEITNVKVDREVFSLFTQRRDWLWKAPLMGFLLYAGEFSAICVWQKLKMLQEERQQHFVREQQVEAMQKRMRETEAFYEDVRRARHEIRNHMANIRGLAANRNYEELEHYMDRLDESMEEPGGQYLTGNAVTDVILNDRYQRARKTGISFQAEFVWKETDTIPVFDVGIILSNLLDNALEACEKLDTGERYVKLCLGRKDRFLWLEVENRFDGKVIREKDSGQIRTSKETVFNGNWSEHGIGLKNVQKIAERYLGGMKIRTDNGIFRVTVLLQQEPEQRSVRT